MLLGQQGKQKLLFLLIINLIINFQIFFFWFSVLTYIPYSLLNDLTHWVTITSKFIIGCKNASNKANFNFYIKEHFINCVENLTIKQFDSMLSKREFSPFFVTRTHHCINVWYEKKIHWLQSLKMVQSGITISSWRNKKLNHFYVCEWYDEKLD